MLLITLNAHSSNVKDNVIRTRKRSAIIFDFMLAAIIVVLVTLGNIELTHLFLFIPLAFYMGNSISASKRKGTNLDYLFLLFAIFVIIIRTFNL